jgi:hypothetical protein
MTVGKNTTVRITATGFPRPVVSESGALPSGVTFQTGNGYGLLTGSPAAGTGNDYNIKFTATNGAGSDSNEPFDLTVIQQPAFPSTFCPAPVKVGQYFHDAQSVAAYPPFFGLNLNSPNPPPGLSFNQNNSFSTTDINEDSGATSGTPLPGTGGTYRLQYQADDDPPVGNGMTRNENCHITINEAPTFDDPGTSVLTTGVRISPQIVSGGTTGFPKSITVTTAGTLPAGMTQFLRQNGKTFGALWRGTPAMGTQGDYPVTVTGTNGISTTEQYVLVVRAPGVTPAPTSLSLSDELDPVSYGSSEQTYTATVTGGASPTGFVQFSLGGGITTVPLVNGAASFTTPSGLEAGDYTVSAHYTGDASNDSSGDSKDLNVLAAPTTLTLTGPASTAFGVAATFTATVVCAPDCGTVPAGQVDFTLAGNDYFANVVDGQATFETNPTIMASTGNEVDATFSSYDDSPGDFAPSNTASTSYDVGDADLTLAVGDGVQTDGTIGVADGDTVPVDPSTVTEISGVLSSADSGDGTPPGPLVVDIIVGSTDETSMLITEDSIQQAPTSDPGTGATDYFWTIPPGALSSLSSSGSATVTVSSAGSSDFNPASETFTLSW